MVTVFVLHFFAYHWQCVESFMLVFNIYFLLGSLFVVFIVVLTFRLPS